MNRFNAISHSLGLWFSADYADTVIYNGTQIYGHVEYGAGGSGANAKHAVLEVQVSDVAEPAYRDTVVIGGQTWRVIKPDDSTGDGYVWKIPVVREEKPRMH